MPKIIEAAGSREQAYDDFKTAHARETSYCQCSWSTLKKK